MADVTVEDVAEAIVTALRAVENAGQFPEAFTASVNYVSKKRFTEVTTDPEVYVFPREETNEPEDRETQRFSLGVGIAILRKVSNSEYETVKPLLQLPRKIRKFLIGLNLVDCEWKSTSIEVLYGGRELKEDLTLVTTIGSSYWIDQ
ncbi:MAG: hypothetical protein NXI29_05510 [bacterium]|nr:hypothetical protein [bacterium]